MTAQRKTVTEKRTASKTGPVAERKLKPGSYVLTRDGRVVLLPTERSVLGRRKIEAAVKRVIAER